MAVFLIFQSCERALPKFARDNIFCNLRAQNYYSDRVCKVFEGLYVLSKPLAAHLRRVSAYK